MQRGDNRSQTQLEWLSTVIHERTGLDLAEVYDRANDSMRAHRLRLSAFECLRQLKPTARVPLYAESTPAELMRELEKIINLEAKA